MNQNQLKSFMGFLEGNILLENLNIRMSWLSITMDIRWRCWMNFHYS